MNIRPSPPKLSALPLVTLLMLLALGRPLSAQNVPSLVNYQGRLANPDGSPLPTADYNLTFKIYDAATNGSLIWGPQLFDGLVGQGHGGRVPVVQGWFNVMLGPVATNGNALSEAFNGAARYVEIAVSNRPPLAPRQQILTTPFAFQAANSAKLAGYDWSALLGTNNPVAGTIPFSKLAQRQVGTNVGVGGVAISTHIVWSSPQADGVKDITDSAIVIQTTGRPVMLMVVPGTPSPQNQRAQTGSITMGNAGECWLKRNGLRISGSQYMSLNGLLAPGGSMTFMDIAAPGGTNTYLLESINVELNGRLVAFEL